MNESKSVVFTIIIPTYNRSSSLLIALKSVLDQTFEDYEVVVVGDGCTDDSSKIVKSLNDKRIIWHNLPFNYGSQWGPNNFGLSVAQGKYVSYLGHDDLWWPNHLELTLKKFQESNADIIASGTIFYYPPESGMRAVTGFFPNDIFNPKYHFAPSSMSHNVEISNKIGGWRSFDESGTNVDVDFLTRAFEAKAKVVSTEEFTVFKFDAAVRRNVYIKCEYLEQENFYNNMRKYGEHFRLNEVTKTLRAAAEDRLIRIEVPSGFLFEKSISNQTAVKAFKGTLDSKENVQLIKSDKNVKSYSPIAAHCGLEWHGIENHDQGIFRWSGPSTHSTIVFPEKFVGLKIFKILVIDCIKKEILTQLSIYIDDIKVEHQLSTEKSGLNSIILKVNCNKFMHTSSTKTHLTIAVPTLWRPVDLDINEDRRWLGIAIGKIDVEDQQLLLHSLIVKLPTPWHKIKRLLRIIR